MRSLAKMAEFLCAVNLWNVRRVVIIETSGIRSYLKPRFPRQATFPEIEMHESTIFSRVSCSFNGEMDEQMQRTSGIRNALE